MQIIEEPGQPVEPYFLAVAKGNVPGTLVFRISGENPDIDSGSGFEDITDLGGTYVPPTQARIHDVVSSSTADDGTVIASGVLDSGSSISAVHDSADFVASGVAVGDLFLNDTDVEIGRITAVATTTLTILDGMHHPGDGAPALANRSGIAYRIVTDASTGCAVAWVEGLDAAKLFLEEFVVMNGTSNVATVGSYVRQFRIRVTGAGTTKDNAGVISSTAQTDSTVTMTVLAGHNQTLSAIFSVPDNCTGYLIQWWGSLSKKQTTTSTIRLKIGQLDGYNYISQTREMVSAGSSEFDYVFPVALPVPSGSDIWVDADASTDNTGVAAGFEILIVEN